MASRFRREILSVMSVAAAGIIVGSLPLWLDRREGPEATERSLPGAGGSVTERITTVGPVYDLAYDSANDAIWYAQQDVSLPDRLFRYDIKTTATSEWEIPDSDYNGFLSQIKVDEEGAVWITQPYRLTRFDPKSETARSVDFTLEVDGALPGGSDPNDPAPGTWVSSIGFAGPDVLVARNNVPDLIRINADLEELGRIKVPEPYAGATDIAVDVDGTVYLLPGVTEAPVVSVLRADGTVESLGVEANRLEAVDGSVYLSGGTGSGLLLRASGVVGELLPTTDGGPESRSAHHPDGGAIVFDAGARTIQKVRDGLVVATYVFPTETVAVNNPLNGEPLSAVVQPAVHDLIVDRRGHVWFVDGNAGVIVGLSL
jgi:hypothetical protein